MRSEPHPPRAASAQSRILGASAPGRYRSGMNTRSPLGQLVVFILVLIVINVVAQLLGLNFRISIIGSIVLTLILGLVMGATRRR